jgi:hypothetical protein
MVSLSNHRDDVAISIIGFSIKNGFQIDTG